MLLVGQEIKKDIEINYTELNIEQLLEIMPDHLLLARYDRAPLGERWRIYNLSTGRNVGSGKPKVTEVLIDALEKFKSHDEHYLP